MTNESYANKHFEIEETLVICSLNPQLIERQIADLTSLPNYQLLPGDSIIIHDYYLDTTDRLLQLQKLALRIRRIESMYWITLKGPPQPNDWRGALIQFEIEELWSRDALVKVTNELKNRRINILKLPQKQKNAPPLDIMTYLGLEIVQDRESHRTVRNIIFAGDEGGSVLAELAIDSVAYHFRDQDIWHREVEIESKVEDGSTVIKAVIEKLLTMYRSTLRKWPYSKLVTGKVIEQLLHESALEGLLDLNNNLMPDAYDKIDNFLKRRNS